MFRALVLFKSRLTAHKDTDTDVGIFSLHIFTLEAPFLVDTKELTCLVLYTFALIARFVMGEKIREKNLYYIEASESTLFPFLQGC